MDNSDSFVPHIVPKNVEKAVVYKGTAWTFLDKQVMEHHSVTLEPPRVTERTYARKHSGGAEDNSNAMNGRDATDILKDLKADWE